MIQTRKLKARKKEIFLFWTIFLVVPIPAILGLLHRGFFDPHDMHHLADIYEMYRGFLSGQFPPRLGPDFSFGYAYPLFNYYYLLPFYLGAFLYSFLGSLTLSLKLVLAFSLLVSYIGMYLFLRLHFQKTPSLSGAALFLYTPYRAVQVYVRGSVGEALALAILPWVLFFIGKYVKEPKNRYIALGSFSFFLLVITHNYFFALTLPIMVLYFLVIAGNSKQFLKRVGGVLLMFFLGFGGTTYWVLPALLEKSLVRGQTPFLLVDHFPFLKQLIIPSWGYGASVWGPGDGLSFQIGLLNLFAVLGLIMFSFYFVFKKVRVKRHQNLVLFALFGFATSFIFMNIRTLPLWNLIPFHDLIQFPWRLLNFTTFFSAIALSLVISFLKSDKQKLVCGFFIMAGFFVSISYFHPSKYFYKNDVDYINLFFNTKSYSEDYLLLPTWVEERPPEPANKLFQSGNAIISDEQKIGILDWRAKVESEGASTVVANRYYFPGWIVKVNGQKVEVKNSGKYGLITFAVPGGTHAIEIGWHETDFRKFSDFVSLVFLLGILTFYYLPDKNKK